MSKLTPDVLLAVFPKLTNAQQVCDALNPALEKYEINNPARLAAFLAQCGHESAGFQARRENLNYSAQGLLATWPRRFNPTKAAALARKPEQIANCVYANRLGNGGPETGDGWRFRGGGWIQLTGAENYRTTGQAIGVPLGDKPELIEQPDVAALSACQFWFSHGLNRLADDLPNDDNDADFEAITRIVNGGLNGLTERRALWAAFKSVLK